MSKLTGKCLCEIVSYQIKGELGPIYNCHCSKCRRWHGAAFRTRASIKAEQFSWLSGEDCLSQFKSSENVTKFFCRNCGSPLVSTYEDRPDVLGIALGGLDQAPSNNPEAHIFVASKAPWFTISDNLKQYEAWPENEDRVRETKS